MISEKDKMMIFETARQYGVKSVFLFGSSVLADHPARDIDLGVVGLAPGIFFKFYGKLLRGLSKPVDVVDLSKDTKFNRLIFRDGIRLYG